MPNLVTPSSTLISNSLLAGTSAQAISQDRSQSPTRNAPEPASSSAFGTALDLLSFCPAFQQHPDYAIEAFSSGCGCTRAALGLSRFLADAPPGAGLSVQSHHLDADGGRNEGLRPHPGGLSFRNRANTEQFYLAGVYRHWGDPPPSEVATRHHMSLSPPDGADGFQLGAVSMLISPAVGHVYSMASAQTGMWARVYAGRADPSPTGLWHCQLMGLAQDLYLKNLVAEVPLAQTRREGTMELDWPTIAGPSFMRMVHGVGVPVMQVNGQRSAMGLADDARTGLLSLECSLFAHSLMRQACASPAGWDAENLNAVFTPALAEWVLQMRSAGVFEGNAVAESNRPGLPEALRDQWLSFLWRTVGQSSVPAQELAVSLDVELQRMALLARNAGRAVTHAEWERACPSLMMLLEGLSQVQDRVRYGGGQLTALPLAGPERAWLNSQLRNLTCMALGLIAPAEIAQFDLLLRAVRQCNNHGFNDDSVNQTLVNHLEWVAATQAGHQSRMCNAMRSWRESLTDSAPDDADPCVFWLDEHSRATAATERPARLFSAR